MGRFNFVNGGGNNNESSNNTSTRPREREEYSYDDGGEESASYNDLLRELWKAIGFCMAGWTLAVIGFCMNYTGNGLGLLLVFLGVIVVDLPCFKILLAGGSLGMMFGAVVGADRIITYSDGSKKRDSSGWSAGMAVTIFTWLATVIVGVFAVVFKIFKLFFALMTMKKDAGVKNDIKRAPWLPVLVGIAFFVVGLIANSIFGAAYDHHENWKDEFTDEETVTMINNAVLGMEEQSFEYKIWGDGYLEDTYATLVKHDPIYGYRVEITTYGATYYGIAAGEYLMQHSVGAWTDIGGTPVTDENTVSLLDGLTIPGLINYPGITGSEEIGNVTASAYWADYYEGEGNSNYLFIIHSESKTGAEQYEFEAGLDNGKWIIRNIHVPYTQEYGDSVEIEFN